MEIEIPIFGRLFFCIHVLTMSGNVQRPKTSIRCNIFTILVYVFGGNCWVIIAMNQSPDPPDWHRFVLKESRFTWTNICHMLTTDWLGREATSWKTTSDSYFSETKTWTSDVKILLNIRFNTSKVEQNLKQGVYALLCLSCTLEHVWALKIRPPVFPCQSIFTKWWAGWERYQESDSFLTTNSCYQRTLT